MRRTPEEAQAVILDAAERVFATRLPDAVGLKEVAREAGTSHGLITHYFGTYEAMVEATLERRFRIVREELVAAVVRLVSDQADATSILAAYRSAIAQAASDPATVRLVSWAMLSGRTAADDFFTHRVQGLKLLIDAVSARSTVPREDLEFVVVASFAMAVVSTVGRVAFAGSLGRKPSRDHDEAFDRRADEMLGAFLHAAERRAKPQKGKSV